MFRLGVTRRAAFWTVGFVVLLALLTLELEYGTSVAVGCGAISLGGGPGCSSGPILQSWAYPALLAALGLPLLSLAAPLLRILAPVGFAFHAALVVLAVWVVPGTGSQALATLPAILGAELASLAAVAVTIRGVGSRYPPTAPQAPRPPPVGGLDPLGRWLFGPTLGPPSPGARWAAGLLVFGGCAAGAISVLAPVSTYGFCTGPCVPPAPGFAGTLPVALLIGSALLAFPALADRSLAILVPVAAAANVTVGYAAAALGSGPYILGLPGVFALLIWDLILVIVFVGLGGVPTISRERGPKYPGPNLSGAS